MINVFSSRHRTCADCGLTRLGQLGSLGLLLLAWAGVSHASGDLAISQEPASSVQTQPASNRPSTSSPLPNRFICLAEQTAGFHDYPHNEEAYEAAVFFESSFELKVNRVLMQHLSETADMYLTLKDQTKFKITSTAPELIELTCTWVRGPQNTRGLSCSDTPPATFFLLNTENWRFTRSSLGGWSFTQGDAQAAGDSIFVEYGHCQPD